MALPKATAERWQEAGAPVTEELACLKPPVLTANPLEAIQLGLIGKLPLTEIRIITDDGKEAGVEEPGELQARGLEPCAVTGTAPTPRPKCMTMTASLRPATSP